MLQIVDSPSSAGKVSVAFSYKSIDSLFKAGKQGIAQGPIWAFNYLEKQGRVDIGGVRINGIGEVQLAI